ncbi:MAG: LPS export ABC transporter periplasmic protein LptC [SAR324 cluster bacterium]|uniref:LPS export ABC transporter periplasmic protein LptC n=1 Tax=SAR324 cluster bacterium TaxID=2024889 RepID=A0A7X9IL73_9DELT|nr:LPS export ABC transporter periplasmic protein LptC [SAR324 cluster bacterium]
MRCPSRIEGEASVRVVMKISRNHSIVLSLICLSVFFGIGFFFSQQQKFPSAQSVKGVSVKLNSDIEGAQIVLDEFHRSESKNGRKMWEIKGKKGEYSPKTSTARITEADLWLYKDSGDIVHLVANQGVVQLDGVTLKTADLQGNVRVSLENKNATITTERAIYDKSVEMVKAPGKVNLTSTMGEISGESLIAKIDKLEFILEKNVQTIIKGGNKK